MWFRFQDRRLALDLATGYPDLDHRDLFLPGLGSDYQDLFPPGHLDSDCPDSGCPGRLG